MDTVREERPLGELVGQLTRETRDLVRKEVHLAATEMRQKAEVAKTQAKWIGIGGALANTGLIVVAAAIVIALDALMPLFLAALIVAAAFLGAGYWFAQKGAHELSEIKPMPERALMSLKENKVWLREQLR
jgi:putative superfamily III holin-X